MAKVESRLFISFSGSYSAVFAPYFGSGQVGIWLPPQGFLNSAVTVKTMRMESSSFIQFLNNIYFFHKVNFKSI
jgi:hypothetical protein